MKTRSKFLRASQLEHHPKNMRRTYPPEQVAEMAASIKTCGGVVQPLLVVRAPKARHYLVVDGNMRLEGARALGAACPLLECRIYTQTEAEQLLDMAVSNGVRFRVNPIDEAQHYHRLIHEQGLSRAAIAKAIGKKPAHIDGLLLWLRLEPEIQELVAAGKLPKDARVARALLAIPAADRVNLVSQVQGASIKAVLKAAQVLAERRAKKRQQLARGKSARNRFRAGDAASSLGLVCRAKRRLAENDPRDLGEPGRLPADSQKYPWPDLRSETRQVCAACEVKLDVLARVPEPAWALLAHNAGEVCSNCSLKAIADTCEACGLVDFLRRLVRQSNRQTCARMP